MNSVIDTVAARLDKERVFWSSESNIALMPCLEDISPVHSLKKAFSIDL